MLLRKLALLLLRLCRLVSFGSCGLNPLALANRLRMSVSETTPISRPDMLDPGTAAAVSVELPGFCDVCGIAGEEFPVDGAEPVT